jgi:flagellar protein FlgJ
MASTSATPISPTSYAPAMAAATGAGSRSRMDPAAAGKAAQDFEAFFIGSMLESMFQGIKTDSLFGGGSGEDMFKSLQVQEYGKAIAKSGGLGIADTVKREMLKLQEVQK